MSDELKPCPFCHASTAYTAPPAMGKGRWVVQCDDCRAEGPQSSDNSDAGELEAIAAWNRRAAPDHGVLIAQLAFQAKTCRQVNNHAQAYLLDEARDALSGNSG